jgi:hypothetical protein
MTDHALIQPSSMNRRMQCPASLSMEMKYPRERGPKAEEGDLAHKVAADRLLGKDNIYGHEVTDEMLDGADLWYISMSKYPGVQVEQRVEIDKDCWGTCDAIVYLPQESHLIVGDYKFGHLFVDAKENWQLITYAAAWCIQNKIWPNRVTMMIVQPRCFSDFAPVRKWSISGELLKHYLDEIKENNQRIMSPNPPCITGGECRDCSARHSCFEYSKSVSAVFDYIGEGLTFDLPESALAKEYRVLIEAEEILKARRKGVALELESRIKSGKNVPGWMLKASYGRVEWTKPIGEVIALGQLMGLDISKPGAITPKQAIKAGLPEALVDQYSGVTKSEIKLAPDDGAKAKEVFGGNK